MSITAFTSQERPAFLDLLVLAMYADGHLASAEAERVQRTLASFGLETDDERNRLLDAAVTRVRQNAGTREEARSLAVRLAGTFASPDAKQAVYHALAELIASDSSVSEAEKGFLSVIREVLRV
ncbi:MAG: TerB family tellurite resistance protein [Verrucomicrobia bacterium]|nr:TerB family tellurite resistance protein [Verrucomicrobiota bacterium]